ncbi:MAG: CAP domain-containing protein [Epsilonproteobacteria bacterium]|nr:CAP domain-containing protein [Campylobacterota bacterium]
MLKTDLLITLVAILFVGCAEQSSTTTKSIDNFEKPLQEDILIAINRARSEVRDCHDGLGLVGPSQPLSLNDELYNSAYEHSNDLAYSNTFAHEGSGTEYDITGYDKGRRSLFFERIESNGYLNYNIVGENIAGGQQSIDEVMEAWLNSPAHCANIMNSKYKEVGIAIVVNPDSEYGIYWTQNFGG